MPRVHPLSFLADISVLYAKRDVPNKKSQHQLPIKKRKVHVKQHLPTTSEKKKQKHSKSIPYAGRGGPGAWNAYEKSLFRQGVILHGWGTWRKIEPMIPTRTKAQIKSHAQKFKIRHPNELEKLQRQHKSFTEKVGRGANGKEGLLMKTATAATMLKNQMKTGKAGAWTAGEMALFRRGVILHGWGTWREIEPMIPTRTKAQIYSHAQNIKINHPGVMGKLERQHGEVFPAAAAALKIKSKKKPITFNGWEVAVL